MMRIEKIIYYLFILLLPLTALGYFYNVFRSWSQNASIYPLILGLIILFFKILKNNRVKTNELVNLFFIFIISILLGSLFMNLYLYFFSKISTSSSDEILHSSLTKIFTLSILFLSFYYPYTQIESKKNVAKTIKLIYLSFIFVILYGYIQVLSLFMPSSFFYDIYMTIQRYINFSWIGITENSNILPQIFINGGRIILTNQEPSIAAYTLQVLLYPFLLSSLITKKSVFKSKIFGLKIEIFFFIFTIPLLFFTFSTSAYFVFILQIIITGIIYLKKEKKTYRMIVRSFTMIIACGIIVFIVLESIPDEYILLLSDSFNKIFMKGAGEGSATTRYGFIVAGFKEFLHYPFFGVGLNNSQYFFSSFIPKWAYNDEVYHYIQTGEALGPKSLWVIFLAETGIVSLIILLYFFIKLTKKYLKIKTYNVDIQFIKYSYLIFLSSFFMHGFNNSALFLIFEWAIIGIFVAFIEIIYKTDYYAN